MLKAGWALGSASALLLPVPVQDAATLQHRQRSIKQHGPWLLEGQPQEKAPEEGRNTSALTVPTVLGDTDWLPTTASCLPAILHTDKHGPHSQLIVNKQFQPLLPPGEPGQLIFPKDFAASLKSSKT